MKVLWEHMAVVSGHIPAVGLSSGRWLPKYCNCGVFGESEQLKETLLRGRLYPWQ